MLEVSPRKAQGIASVIGYFSNLIQLFPMGDRAINLEIAITGYKIIDTVLTYETFPKQWAEIQYNLGLSYYNRLHAERAKNLEAAIECYFNALKVYTRSSFPQEWVDTQNNLSAAYRKRIRGRKAENLEAAICCLQAALEVRTREIFPHEWAYLQTNLGTVYSFRIHGEKAENLEVAIRCLESALEVRTREALPQQWAETKNNLGIAYYQRILGERAENLEVAIRYYEAALEVRTCSELPIERAQTQLNLANAYSERIRGKKADNLEEAIIFYKAALMIRTINAFSEEYAIIENNLGCVYCDRIHGKKSDNVEAAISCFQAALKVRTLEKFPLEWAETKNNLGTAYDERILEKRTNNLELAIRCYKDVLKIYARSDLPFDWGKTQHNLGNVYSERIVGENRKNLKTAIRHYKAALQVFTRFAFPQNYLLTKFSLGRAYQEGQNFQDSYTAFTDAFDIIEFWRGEIISGSGTEGDKQKLAEEWNELYQRMVAVCLELENYTQTIEYVERSKTRNLVELILTRDRHTIFPAEVVAQLDRLRDEIASGQYELQNATAQDPTALAQHLQQLRQQRNELQDRYLPIGSGFQFEPFRATLSHRSAIVEFYITTDRLFVFIITNQTQQPIVLPLDFINPNKLANWANSYLKAYSNKKSHWQRRLTTRLHLLAKILHVDEIIEQIPTECDQLILIPHRYLHLLPLHALPLTEDSSLFDRFPGGVSYAPSCQLQQLAQTRQRPEFTHLFAVQNPTGDLSYTDLEVETIQSYFNTSNLLKQKIATKEAIDNTSLSNVHCAHFSCHAYFNESESRKSALILANAELNSAPTQSDPENYLSLKKGGVLDLNKCLTLDGIFTLNLEQCRLVTLSACETGLIDFQNTSDEYIGLPSGFLYAGASNVVSSLWTVNDISTAFLMIKFYQNLQDFQTSPTIALALNKAQIWLRDATKKELHGWINELPDPVSRRELLNWIRPIKAETKPFESPHYWAAFCAIGQ
ncbi:CHAT domain-containing protein [Argonema antarcticum]|uniref:CHAT domain-containing protein n=1 Tax=Argonema antarcticum TaxID=2942763 RepID=UPI002012E42A|nr:CHAT domain-containing tetratricopeptide repeat protein [Argonema antarcticum]